ncbi:MAG TPA: SMC-Scp complex subunit ScpB, partial [Oligoflexia bacterium]|nr:SMC-Scp complex subunit ScpB [Oligoflexia bacterium]
RTKPHMASVLRKLVKTTPLKLSPTNLEVLAVVAYKQPVTKDELDQIRGVDSGYVIRNLMEKRLVRIIGRSELPGRPMLYGTTHEFLELFSLKDLKALPPLHEVEQLVAQSEVGDEQAEQAALQDFGVMVEKSDKILFDDNGIDIEVESLRAEIAAIPISTAFIEEQKAQEKRSAKLIELAAQGLTLDENDNVVAIEALKPNEHLPSPELQRAAELAMNERHLEAISETVDQAVSLQPNSDSVVEDVREREPESTI